jgi:spore coat polysaccharide biosynthesis predicted glycosyltransferase SpsG
MHLAIRADGGPEIGYGHLARSRALAEVVCQRGHEVTVATATPRHAEDVFQNAVDIVQLPSRDDPTPFITWIDTGMPDVVFTDAYPIETTYQRAVRDRVSLAVLQDDARNTVCADLFVNGNFYAHDLDYKFEGQPPVTCLGTDYVLLRREIGNMARIEPPWRDPPEQALITMGGNDVSNLTPLIVRAFDERSLHVDVIVGPGFTSQQEREIKNAARQVSTDTHVARDPDDLPERMFGADFAVSTASSTTYELLALGTPPVSIPVVADQQPIATALEDRNLGVVLENNPNSDAFRYGIDKYMIRSSLRHERYECGRDLVDGHGATRVADAVHRLAS